MHTSSGPTTTFNSGVLRFCAWMGPTFILTFLIGAVPLSQFFPPASPGQGIADTVHLYNDNLTGVRLGCLLMCISVIPFLPWGLSMAYATRRAETGFPILFWIQVTSAAICTLIILLIPLFWGIGSFRPDAVGPEITQTWNDAGWFAVLFAWPPFTLWCLALAAAILSDPSPTPRVARWVGYLNAWVGFLFIPAGLMIFFKTGPFSWAGVVTFYIPVVTIFIWVAVMTRVVLRTVATEAAETSPAKVELDDDTLPTPRPAATATPALH